MKITRSLAGVLTACTLAALSLSAHADIIFPDFNYGTLGNGAVIDPTPGPAHSAVLVTGNKLLVPSNNIFGVSRYNSDGSLDTTFGTNGRVGTNFGRTDGFAYALAVQSDGKILVGGATIEPNSGTFQSTLARFTASGVLDTTFAVGGKTAILTGNINAIAIQSDGKIVTAGKYNGNGLLARFNTDGSADFSFGSNGRVSVTVGTSYSFEGFTSMAIQGDGKIVATGSFGGNFVTGRYNTNGSPDTSFGTSGRVSDSFGTIAEAAPHSLGIFSSTGKIVVAGEYNNSLAYARYNSNGTLDTTFGTGGHVTATVPEGASAAYALRILSAGKMLVVGKAGPYALIGRVNVDGSADTGFNSGTGYYNGGVDENAQFDYAYAVVIQSDSKFLIAGTTGSGTSYNLMLQRFTINPALVPASKAPSTRKSVSSSASGS